MSVYGMDTLDNNFTMVYVCDSHSEAWQQVNKNYFRECPINSQLSLPCVDCGMFATKWLVSKEYFK